ncbi:unnamed protein product [Symbiodinium natans]|uniref:Uncharacterized protein n=1 Tax=Symbiodinium natans TaxID=878477 RepID=A0A812UB44_9DINO|nr:unnamed protein product [Symbiodinium natans]
MLRAPVVMRCIYAYRAGTLQLVRVILPPVVRIVRSPPAPAMAAPQAAPVMAGASANERLMDVEGLEIPEATLSLPKRTFLPKNAKKANRRAAQHLTCFRYAFMAPVPEHQAVTSPL